jgi:hypothetical protein
MEFEKNRNKVNVVKEVIEKKLNQIGSMEDSWGR